MNMMMMTQYFDMLQQASHAEARRVVCSCQGLCVLPTAERAVLTRSGFVLRQVGEGQGNQTIFIPHTPGAVGGAQSDILSMMRQGHMEGAMGVQAGTQPRPGGITFNGTQVTQR